MMTANAAALSDTGRVRSSNEDSFGYRADHGIYVVCDGMGGAAGGEIASRIAVDTVLRRVCAQPAGYAWRETLHEAIAEANKAVLQRAEHETELYGMGTTLVALLLRPGAALIAHAGDSRCYLFREGQLTRCTHDHSLVDEQIRLGTMTPEEAARSPLRSVITRAIGTQPTVVEDMLELAVQPGDWFLLCSDGLTREVSDRGIAEVLALETDPERAAQRLIEAANEAGGRDNVTSLLVRISQEETA